MERKPILTRVIVKIMSALNTVHGDEYSPEYFLIYGIAVFPVNLLTKTLIMLFIRIRLVLTQLENELLFNCHRKPCS